MTFDLDQILSLCVRSRGSSSDLLWLRCGLHDLVALHGSLFLACIMCESANFQSNVKAWLGFKTVGPHLSVN